MDIDDSPERSAGSVLPRTGALLDRFGLARCGIPSSLEGSDRTLFSHPEYLEPQWTPHSAFLRDRLPKKRNEN